jgi:hypothetical protein
VIPTGPVSLETYAALADRVAGSQGTMTPEQAGEEMKRVSDVLKASGPEPAVVKNMGQVTISAAATNIRAALAQDSAFLAATERCAKEGCDRPKICEIASEAARQVLADKNNIDLARIFSGAMINSCFGEQVLNAFAKAN